jgi:hypothetical protein
MASDFSTAVKALLTKQIVLFLAEGQDHQTRKQGWMKQTLFPALGQSEKKNRYMVSTESYIILIIDSALWKNTGHKPYLATTIGNLAYAFGVNVKTIQNRGAEFEAFSADYRGLNLVACDMLFKHATTEAKLKQSTSENKELRNEVDLFKPRVSGKTHTQVVEHEDHKYIVHGLPPPYSVVNTSSN